MSYLLTTLLPIFGLILAGFAGRKRGVLGPAVASELNRFVVWLCLPALLFRSTATMPFEHIWNPDFVLVFSISTLLVFTVILLAQLSAGASLSYASMKGLCASYANTGYVGIPLCILVLGEAGLEPALVATLIVVSLLFAVAVICIEVDINASQSLTQTIGKVALALAKNPLVVTPLLGIGWNLSGFGLNDAVDTFLKLLGDATTPCALVSLGAFLAHKQAESHKGSIGLVATKLILHPLITWILAYHLLPLPELWAKAAVLVSALPTGTGPYMLAEYYKRDAPLASRTTLISTVGSLVTLSILLLVL